MIERITKRLEDKRFLGDEAAMIVHDLENEDTTEQGCYIDDVIEKGNAVVFFPDTFDEAHRQGYQTCRCCIGKRQFRLRTKLRIEE